MASSPVMRRTLQKAAELVGGNRPLARRLRVPLGELEKWISGGGEPPMAIFLRAVDLVLDEAPYLPAASEPGEAPEAKDCAAGGARYL